LFCSKVKAGDGIGYAGQTVAHLHGRRRNGLPDHISGREERGKSEGVDEKGERLRQRGRSRRLMENGSPNMVLIITKSATKRGGRRGARLVGQYGGGVKCLEESLSVSIKPTDHDLLWGDEPTGERQVGRTHQTADK